MWSLTPLSGKQVEIECSNLVLDLIRNSGNGDPAIWLGLLPDGCVFFYNYIYVISPKYFPYYRIMLIIYSKKSLLMSVLSWVKLELSRTHSGNEPRNSTMWPKTSC